MLDNPIRLLPDDYRLKRDEVKTKDDQKVAYATRQYGVSVAGAVFSREDKAVYWVVRDDSAWQTACEDFANEISKRDELIGHSKAVAMLKRRAREIRNARI